MQEMKKRRQIVVPSFGNWESFDEVGVTQYFESARQAGLLRGHSFRGVVESDLFMVVPPSPLPYYHYSKTRRAQQYRSQCRPKQPGKQGRVCDSAIHPPRRPRAARAVDEDLYKIPTELLHQKTRKRVVLSKLWKKCMILDCVP